VRASAKGPAWQESLLTTRRPEFRPLVSYRSYRLAIRDQTVDDRITSKVNGYLKMMKHHVSEPFTGEHAIRIFDFLPGMRDSLNVNRISEGAAYLLLSHLLGWKAKHGVLSRWKQVSSALPRYPDRYISGEVFHGHGATPTTGSTGCGGRTLEGGSGPRPPHPPRTRKGAYYAE
jgi:hypothetical protein